MSAEVAAQPVPGQDELLDREALQLIGDLERRFGPRRRDLLRAREEREQRFAAGERPAFPEETRELREAEWAVASTPHDLEDRRVEITGPAEAKMVINALNSGASVFMCCLEDALSPTWANVVAGHAAVRDATRRTLEFSSPEGKQLRARRDARDARRPAARMAPGRAPRARGRSPGLGEPVRPGALPALERPRVGGARQRALRLPREARGPLRGRALERRVRRRAGGRRTAPRHHPGDGPDRDDHGLVRDGGDPVRPARALGRAQRRPLGLHLQRHQEVPRRSGARAARPCRRDDGRAVHARLHRAARARLPSPRRTRHRRHGGVHPEPRRRSQRAGVRSRPGRQGARGESGLRRHLGGAPRPRAAGARDLRRGARRPSQPEDAAARGRRARRRRAARARPHPRGDHAPGRPDERLRGPALPRRLARRRRRGGDRQPHGRRSHGRDLASAAVAVDPARMPHERGRGHHAASSTSASATRCWRDCRPSSTRTSATPVAYSTPSCWTRASRPS